MASDGSIKILTDLDTSGFEKGINKLSGLAPKGLGTVLKSVAAVSGALGAASGFAVKVGSDFEAGMSEVAAISGATGKDLEALTAKAKEMGATTKFSATESAEALKYMAMAGWDTDKMLSGLPGVMNLAAASGENLGTVSDIVTDAMTAFGLSADKAGHFADVLAQASSKSNTNVGMMGETFKYVAPVAGALGYSVEDAAVAIGLMANSGIKGSQAGTALRSTLSRLAKPTDEVEAAMEDLGISLTDSEGNMKSLGEVMLDMRKGFKNLTKDQQAQYAASIAGQEGMSGLLAIVNASDEDFNTLTEAIQNSDGAAQSMADTMQDNLKGAVTIAKSALEGLGITVYGHLQKPMKTAVESATKYINKLNAAFETGLDSGVAAFGEVVADAAVQIANQAPKIVKTAANLISSFASGIRRNAKQITKAALDCGTALIDALREFIPEIISTAIELTAALADNLFGKQVGDAVRRFGDTLQGTFSIASQTIQTVIDIGGDLISLLGGPLISVLDIVLQGVNGILTVINWALSGIASFTDGLNIMYNGTQTAAEGVASFTEAELALKEQADSVAEAIANQHAKTVESMESTNAEMDHTRALAEELLGLVDANGKVADGEEARAQFIIDTLNGALDTEITMTDGVISNYDDLKDSIYELIEAKRVDALMNAYYDDYQLALKNTKDAQDRMTEACDNYAERRAATQEIERQYYAEKSKLAEMCANESGEYTFAEVQDQREIVDALQGRFGQERQLTAASKQQWESYVAEYGSMQDTITNYETAYEEVLKGNYAEAQSILQGKSDAYSKHGDAVSKVTEGIEKGLQKEEKAASDSSDKVRKSLNKATEGVADKADREVTKASNAMSQKFAATKLTVPKVTVNGAVTAAANAISAMQSYANSRSISVSVRTSHAAGGYWARGGVTKYARGGITPEIHKHAAGVFTKRTRLWDPVTGINEYGEAGHEALLPLKTSVYDEIAKGIVRQLSPAKLSGIVDMLRSAVRERNETVTVQVQERRDLRAAEKATLHEEDSGVEELREEVAVLGSRMEQVLTLLKELLGTSKSRANALLQALLGMRIDLDGEAVGRLIAPEINERLNDLYELEERGRF